jgi:hypothetical protein
MAQSNWDKTYDEGCLKADLTAARGTNKLRSIFKEEVAVWFRNLWDNPDLSMRRRRRSFPKSRGVASRV